MAEEDNPEACPDLADLATFCWGGGSDTFRALMLAHVARCLRCRQLAARIAGNYAADSRAPAGEPGPDEPTS